jgi:hypothetical protein
MASVGERRAQRHEAVLARFPSSLQLTPSPSSPGAPQPGNPAYWRKCLARRLAGPADAKGVFGSVYRFTGFAAKVISLRDPETLWNEEAAVLKQCQGHVNVVQLLHVAYLTGGHQHRKQAIFMENVPGRLDDVARVPSAHEAVLLGLLRGLDHVVQQGFVHADIKADNIRLRVAGGVWVPVLVDFGAAAVIGEGDTSHLRTTLYVCPWECHQDGRCFGKSYDMWSLAATLFYAWATKGTKHDAVVARLYSAGTALRPEHRARLIRYHCDVLKIMPAVAADVLGGPCATFVQAAMVADSDQRKTPAGMLAVLEKQYLPLTPAASISP